MNTARKATHRVVCNYSAGKMGRNVISAHRSKAAAERKKRNLQKENPLTWIVVEKI